MFVKIKAALLISLIFVFTILSVTACTTKNTADSAVSADIQTLLTDKMKKLNFCGVVRLSKDGEVYEAANGTVGRDGSEGISTDSQYQKMSELASYIKYKTR